MQGEAFRRSSSVITNGFHYVMPQFQTNSCESDLPKGVFDPQFSETFSVLELHPALQFQKGSV
jgi:hypothetical protein